MPVIFDTSAAQETTSAIAVCSMNIAAASCLLVGVGTTGGAISVSACAVNGTPLTQLGRFLNNSAGVVTTLFGLTAAPTGVVSISANLVGGGVRNIFLVAASYRAHRASNPFGTVVGNSASETANIVLSYSTSTTHRVIFFGVGVNTMTAMNATSRQVSPGDHVGGVWADTAGPGSTISISCSALITVQNMSFLGVNIAASISVVGQLSRMLTGVGR